MSDRQSKSVALCDTGGPSDQSKPGVDQRWNPNREGFIKPCSLHVLLCSIATQFMAMENLKKKIHCYTIREMALGAQLPIRLDRDTDLRLDAVAEKSGTTKSALIRLLAKTFVDQVVSSDGTVRLPPNWRDLLPPSDGRSRRSEKSPPKKKGVNFDHNERDKPGRLGDKALEEEIRKLKPPGDKP